MADIREPGQVSRAQPPRSGTTPPKAATTPPQPINRTPTINVANARRTQGNAVMSVSQGVKVPRIAPAKSTDIRNLPGLQGTVARYGYWDNPLRVVRYHNAMQSLPPEQRANIPLDEQGLGAAYNRLAEYNQGRPPEQWSAPMDTGDDEPYFQITRGMPEPPQEMRPYYEWANATKENPNPWKQAGMGDLYPLAKSEAEQYFTDVSGLQTQGDNVLVPASWLYGGEDTQPQQDMTNGIPTETYNNLKPWQRFLLNATPAGSGAAMGGGQGAVMGLISGGPAGAVVGGALGGGLGGLFGLAADNPIAQKAISVLNVLDAPAEGVERTIGVVSQLVNSALDPDQYGSIDEVLSNLPQAWQAGHFTENVADIGSLNYDPITGQTTAYAWEVTNPEPVVTTYKRGQSPSSLMLAEARKRLIQGESIETIEADLRARVGMAYDFREAIGHMILDPLNVVALGENALIKAGAKWAKNAPLLKAVDTITDLNKTRNVFNQAGGIDVLGEYARNLRMLKPAELARFAPLSRFIAGVDDAGNLIDYANQPRARAAVAKALQNAITLTPQSKANIMTYQLAQGLDVMIHDAADAREIEHGIRAVANITPDKAVTGLDDANMMQWFESAEAQPAPGAVKAALPRVEAVIEAWKNVQDAPGRAGAVTILQRAADAASTDGKKLAINDVIRMFGEATGKEDFERIYRGMAETIQANVQAGAVDKSMLAEFMQGGYGKYAELARMFYGPDGAPFTLDQLKARVSAALAQGMEEYAVKYFNIKPTGGLAGWGERASNAVKSFQTLTMLNTPSFMANNILNNLLTMSWDGLIGISRKSARRGWLRGMGMDVEKMRIGMTAADLGKVGGEIDKAKKRPYQMGEVIRKAKDADLSRFEVGLSSFVHKLSLFPRMSKALEDISSELAYYHAIRPYWDAVWTSGKGFDRMGKEYKVLAGYLDGIQPGTSKKIEQMISRSKSRAEIERAIFNGFQTSGIKDALTPEDMEILHVIPGLVDDIDTGLKEAKTPQDVRQVFNTARERVVKQVRTETRKQARAKAEKVLTRLSVEGVAGGAAEFDEVIDARASALMQHFDRMQAVADDINERGLMGKERAAVWQRARAEEDQVFRAFEDDEAAKWLGMFQALGSTDAEGAALLALLGEGSQATGTMGLHSNWRRFFTQTAEEYANFHALPDDMPKAEKAKAWDDLNIRLLDEYNAAVLEEDRIMERIDDLTAKLYARGKQDSTYAYRDMLNWRLSQRDVRRKMAGTMSYYRGGKVPAGMEDWVDPAIIEKVRGYTRNVPLHRISMIERQVTNEWFYKNVYRPLVAEQAQVGHATQPKAPKPPATPAPEPTQPKPPAGPAAGTRQPTQPRIVETPKVQTQRVDQSALWKRIAETKPDIAGVTPEGQFDPTAKQMAIRFMKKNHPDAMVKKFDDITPESWDIAVKNENLRKAAAQPLIAADTAYPQVERRIDADMRAMFQEFYQEAKTLGLTDEQIRGALPRLLRDRETKALTYTVYEAMYNTLVDQGKTPHVAGMDLRGLHMTNKNFGDAVGNAYIAQVQRVAEDMGIGFLARRREGGDEFVAISDDPTKLQAQMQELSDRFERSIIVVDGREYDGLKLHWGIATGTDAERTAGAAIDASTAARNNDADWNARYAGRDYTLSARTGSAEGLDVREGEPAQSAGADTAGRPETGAADIAAVAASNGEPRQPDLIPDVEPDTVDALPDDTYLVSDAGEVVDPRDLETVEPARPPAKEAVTGNMRAFIRGMGEFDDEAIATARVYQTELAQSRTVKVPLPDGGFEKVWENPPVWYKGHYDFLKAEDKAYNLANAGAIRRDKHKPRNTRRVVRSNKAGSMHGYVAKAIEYIILKMNPPRDAPILDQWIGWVRTQIAYSMANPQENFNPEFAWWVGEKDIVLETLDDKIKTILADPAANEDTVARELGRYGDQIIDEYLVRTSAANNPEAVDVDTLPNIDPVDLEESALRIADNIDASDAKIDIEERFTRTKDDFERAVMEAMPEDGDLVIELADSLARNFNPEIDTQDFYNRMGWSFGGEYAGEEGLQRVLRDKIYGTPMKGGTIKKVGENPRKWIVDGQSVLEESIIKYFKTEQEAIDYAVSVGFEIIGSKSGPFGIYEYSLEHIETRNEANKIQARVDDKWKDARPVYLRFGEAPPSGRSYNRREGTMEAGISVYRGQELPSGEVRLAPGASGDEGLGYEFFRNTPNKKLYVVEGDEIGIGSDGEPLLRSAKIKRTVQEGLFRATPQGVDGLTTFTEQGRALMRIYKATDPTAAAHELIHGITPLMRQADADLLRGDLLADMNLPEDWHTSMGYVGTGDQLSPVYVDAYERVSNAFSRYLADGQAPTPGLQGLFSRMKNWMLSVYKRIVGGDLDIEISPETRRMFDRWVSGEQPEPPRPEPAPEIAPETQAAANLDRPTQAETSLWDAPTQAGLFTAEDLPLFSGTAMRAQAETFAPKPTGGQDALFNMAEQLPTIEARQAGDAAMPEGGLFGQEAQQATPAAVEAPAVNPTDGPYGGWATESQLSFNGPKKPPPFADVITVSPDDIDYQFAMQAYRGVSMVPEARAARQQYDYVQHMRKLIDFFKPLADTKMAKLAEHMERYKQGYIERIKAYLSAKSRVVSAFIAGPSNFPGAQMAKRGATEDRRLNDLIEWSKKAQAAIKRDIAPEEARGIKTGDPRAAELIQGKIAGLEKLQSAMVESNKIVRKKNLTDAQKIEQMIALGLTEKQAREVLKPDYAGRTGFPSYALSNNNAEIRRLNDRLAEVSRLQSATVEDLYFNGGQIVENVDADRIQILFDAKPDEAMRDKLKSRGFRWAPSEGAWQRQRTSNAREVVKQLFPDAKPRQAEAPAQVDEFIEPPTLDIPEDQPRQRTGGLLFRLSQDATPAPLDARDLPVGTVDQMAPPPTDSATLEILRDRILPMLDKAEGTLAADATRGNKLFDFETMDPEMRKQLRAYMGKVGGQMGDAKLAALRYGKAKRDFALLPYERRYNADTALQGIMPYEFWYTRSMMNWAIRAMNKPQIIANYLRLQQFFNEQQQRGGFPTRLKKKAFVRLPFLPEWMGEGVYIDPYKQIFPFLQLTGPFERMYSQENQAIQRATTLLQQQVEDGTLDAAEAQQAIEGRSGLTWQEALAQAKNEIDADVQNPVDFARMISGFSLPLNIAYLYATGRQDEISQLPSTRLVQNVTAPLGIGGPRGINLEAGIRNMAGLPEVDRFEDYRVDRILAGMAADGDISAEDAQRAMIDREGPAFEMAQRKVSAMGTAQYFGAPLALDFFPEGEQDLRALRDVYNTAYQKYKAGDKTALTKFFDKHPEYQARMASFQEPDERLKRFLISEVWERYNALPSIYKQQTREQLGATFTDAFLSKETRSYDSIQPETLATWARAIGTDNLPNRTPDTPQIGLKFAPAETAAAVEQYNAEADRLFPGIGQFLASFYQMPQEQQDKARAQYPQIQAYYSWKNKYLAEHQAVIPWVTSEQSELFGLPQDLQAGVYTYRAQRDELFPSIDAVQDGYYQEGIDQKAYLKQHPELREYWDWRKAMAAQKPELSPYILSDKALQNAILNNRGSGLSSEAMAALDPVTTKHLLAFFYAREPLRAGVMGELDDIWQAEGQPYGDIDVWIQKAVKPALTGY